MFVLTMDQWQRSSMPGASSLWPWKATYRCYVVFLVFIQLTMKNEFFITLIDVMQCKNLFSLCTDFKILMHLKKFLML